MESLELFAFIVGAAAAVAGVRYLFLSGLALYRYLRLLADKLENLSVLANYELNSNGGASIKDTVTHSAMRLLTVETELHALRREVTEHIRSQDTQPEGTL
jgi:hypothetical protein